MSSVTGSGKLHNFSGTDNKIKRTLDQEPSYRCYGPGHIGFYRHYSTGFKAAFSEDEGMDTMEIRFEGINTQQGRGGVASEWFWEDLTAII